MFTFIYDFDSKKLSLNPLTDFSVEKINLPITTCANGSQLVSYFNKDLIQGLMIPISCRLILKLK